MRAWELRCAQREIDLLRLRGERLEAKRHAARLDEHFEQLDAPLRASHQLHKLLLDLEDGELEVASERMRALERLKNELEFSDAITFQLAASLHDAMRRRIEQSERGFALARSGASRAGLCTLELATLSELLAHSSRDAAPSLAEKAEAFARGLLARLGASSRLSLPSSGRRA